MITTVFAGTHPLLILYVSQAASSQRHSGVFPRRERAQGSTRIQRFLVLLDVVPHGHGDLRMPRLVGGRFGAESPGDEGGIGLTVGGSASRLMSSQRRAKSSPDLSPVEMRKSAISWSSWDRFLPRAGSCSQARILVCRSRNCSGDSAWGLAACPRGMEMPPRRLAGIVKRRSARRRALLSAPRFPTTSLCLDEIPPEVGPDSNGQP